MGTSYKKSVDSMFSILYPNFYIFVFWNMLRKSNPYHVTLPLLRIIINSVQENSTPRIRLVWPFVVIFCFVCVILIICCPVLIKSVDSILFSILKLANISWEKKLTQFAIWISLRDLLLPIYQLGFHLELSLIRLAFSRFLFKNS